LPLSRKTRSGTCRLPFPLLLLLPDPSSFRHNLARQDPATDFSTEAEAGIVRGTSASLLFARAKKLRRAVSLRTGIPSSVHCPVPHHQQLFVGLTCLTARASCSPPAPARYRFWRLKVGPPSIARPHTLPQSAVPGSLEKRPSRDLIIPSSRRLFSPSPPDRQPAVATTPHQPAPRQLWALPSLPSRSSCRRVSAVSIHLTPHLGSTKLLLSWTSAAPSHSPCVAQSAH
jgi:hypothetical protein